MKLLLFILNVLAVSYTEPYRKRKPNVPLYVQSHPTREKESKGTTNPDCRITQSSCYISENGTIKDAEEQHGLSTGLLKRAYSKEEVDKIIANEKEKYVVCHPTHIYCDNGYDAPITQETTGQVLEKKGEGNNDHWPAYSICRIENYRCYNKTNGRIDFGEELAILSEEFKVVRTREEDFSRDSSTKSEKKQVSEVFPGCCLTYRCHVIDAGIKNEKCSTYRSPLPVGFEAVAAKKDVDTFVKNTGKANGTVCYAWELTCEDGFDVESIVPNAPKKTSEKTPNESQNGEKKAAHEPSSQETNMFCQAYSCQEFLEGKLKNMFLLWAPLPKGVIDIASDNNLEVLKNTTKTYTVCSHNLDRCPIMEAGNKVILYPHSAQKN